MSLRLESPRFAAGLGALLAAGALLHLWLLSTQAAVDPGFVSPGLDGAVYVAWAKAIAAGETEASAFYRAPLYPYALAALFTTFGEHPRVIYGLQHLVVLATAGLLGWVLRRSPAAALSAAALWILYHPASFFASRFLGETLGVALLMLAWSQWRRQGAAAAVGCAVAAGLTVLTRPHLILVPLVWSALAWHRGQRCRAVTLLLGTGLVIAPVAIRNTVVSGHFVPVSANAGLTAYHGNGPGARGVFHLPAGFSGNPSTQRSEATSEARARSGLDLDDVQADRWWASEAVRVRLSRPIESLQLQLMRTLLFVDNYEHAQDAPPAFDPNPWSRLLWVPFGLILGLALAALTLHGVRGSGGRGLWLGVLAAAVTPLLFYASSRYRLPVAAMLCVPAGFGLVGLVGRRRLLSDGARSRRRAAWAVLGASLIASLSVPSAELRREAGSKVLANRAAAWLRAGDPERALEAARRARDLDSGNAVAWFNLGVTQIELGRHREAEEAFRQALRRRPGFGAAAVNLSTLLIDRGASEEAVELLADVLEHRPGDRDVWSSLIVALAESGDIAAARGALEQAVRLGVALDPGLIKALADP